MKNLLICGDSFAADWTVKFSGQGWVNKLNSDFTVTNLAQAGCSEYKILKQLQSVKLSKFDLILVSHTSPYRLYVTEHPVHKGDSLHNNSCLLYADVAAKMDSYPELKPITDYFENYFNIEYAEHMHNLLLKEIEDYCPSHTLHISHIEWKRLHIFKNFLNFKSVFEKHPGNFNHYDATGNQIVYDKIRDKLNESA